MNAMKLDKNSHPCQALELQYSEFGDPNAPPVVLLIGLGMQRFEWPKPFLTRLAQSYRVICIDNRDAGNSPHCGPESETAAAYVWLRGDSTEAAELASYTLLEMRDDTLALLNKLEIDTFDLIGFSMGSMIGQLVAMAAGSRLRNFVQLAGDDGTPNIDGTEEAIRRVARLFCAPKDPAKLNELLLDDAFFYSAGRLEDNYELRSEIEKICASYSHGGAARHALAILATPDRRHQLHTIQAATLVVHGGQDPCIAPKQGRSAASLIPNAKFKLLPEAGHILNDDMCNAALNWLLPPQIHLANVTTNLKPKHHQ